MNNGNQGPYGPAAVGQRDAPMPNTITNLVDVLERKLEGLRSNVREFDSCRSRLAGVASNISGAMPETMTSNRVNSGAVKENQQQTPPLQTRLINLAAVVDDLNGELSDAFSGLNVQINRLQESV